MVNTRWRYRQVVYDGGDQLTDLVNRYAPHTKRLLEEFTEMRPALVAPDGEIYATAARTVPPISNYKNWYIREDWLQSLGLEKPETLEDWSGAGDYPIRTDPELAERGRPPGRLLDRHRRGVVQEPAAARVRHRRHVHVDSPPEKTTWECHTTCTSRWSARRR